MTPSSLARATLAALTTLSCLAANATTYHLTDLGPDTYGAAINANGDVAGAVDVYQGTSPWVGVWHAATGTWTRLGDGDMVDGINDHGTVVGARPGKTIQGVRWGADGHPHVVKIEGSISSILLALANDGRTYGYWTDAALAYHPFKLEHGTVVDLGCPTAAGCIPVATSRAGLVAGHIYADGDPLGTYQAGVYRDGAWTNLGTLGGINSYANAVNANGRVVGASNYRPKSAAVHAFMWHDGGVMQDLHTAGGPYSSAEAVADDGTVAGATSDAAGTYGAALWFAGTWTFLAPLVDNLDGFDLADAQGLTKDGRILVNAYKDNFAHAVILTPVAP